MCLTAPVPPPSGHTSRPSSKQIHGSYLLLAVMQDIRGRGDYPTYVFFSLCQIIYRLYLQHADSHCFTQRSANMKGVHHTHQSKRPERSVRHFVEQPTIIRTATRRNGDDWVRLRIPVKLRGGEGRGESSWKKAMREDDVIEQFSRIGS
jgi:hypothetical protein